MSAAAPFDALESRRLLAATLNSSGLLDVVGTSGGDTVALTVSGTNIVVRINASTPQNFAASAVRAIRVGGLAGNDRITVAAGIRGATLAGGDGNDTVVGGSNNDTIVGDAGHDSLAGGNGNDTLVGGTGNDTLSGQGGFDAADYRPVTSAVRITLDNVANDGQANVAERDNVLDAEQLLGSNHSDTIFGNAGVNQIYGGAGNDEIRAHGGNDSVYGGPGNDQLYGGDLDSRKFDYVDPARPDLPAHVNTLAGGAGDDHLFNGIGDDLMSGGAGADTANYSIGRANEGVNVTLDGVRDDGERPTYYDYRPYLPPYWEVESDNVGADVENVLGSHYSDRIVGNAANNRLTGNWGDDTLIGGDGNDVIDVVATVAVGPAGERDYVDAGNGDDTIFARDGRVDTILGGAGYDRAQLDGPDQRSGIEQLLA